MVESSVDDLVRRLRELEERVAHLEAPAQPPGDTPTAPEPTEDRFWALNELKRLAEADQGGVLFTGFVNLSEEEKYEWQQGAHASDIVDWDWSELSDTIDALGHPVRLLLLQRVLTGTRGSAELRDDPALGTTGQLYHHLRRLVAAGWLQMSGRGRYRVPPSRVVPLLTILFAARH
ncbi:ArsR family transcriptional regulator [Salinactinospora qingdaonensis]|uniref:Helix-turn-helix domain-containing protein n=1 Tax=Salinactinospora qingdaonensis TaxID=702744 RepID=A0ABP7F3B8_9ACTN